MIPARAALGRRVLGSMQHPFGYRGDDRVSAIGQEIMEPTLHLLHLPATRSRQTNEALVGRGRGGEIPGPEDTAKRR